jgi:hypothetical protein
MRALGFGINREEQLSAVSLQLSATDVKTSFDLTAER